MNRPVARYRPSRKYAMFALLALVAAIPSAWASTFWGAAWLVSAVLLGLTATTMLLLAVRPTIEVHRTHLMIGKRIVFWSEIQRLDRISVLDHAPWAAPLLLRLTLPETRTSKKQEILLFHPGDLDSCVSLLRHIYRNSKAALLDGVPYNQFWGEPPVAQAPLALPPPRLLLPEDEEEVERLFQRLKVAGRLDGSDET